MNQPKIHRAKTDETKMTNNKVNKIGQIFYNLIRIKVK